MLCYSYILVIQINDVHTTVRYSTVVTQSQNDYTGEAEIVVREENRGVTLKKKPTFRYERLNSVCVDLPCVNRYSFTVDAARGSMNS